jgi:A/G-specific adenine glycosylase
MQGSPSLFARQLVRWYRRHGRDLPWRRNEAAGRTPQPYHVLVSEAMLQQTQVTTVIPYYHRFIARFPTIRDLAEADEQEVLRLWQGLGYYARARNLRAAARVIVSGHGGEMPRTLDGLLALPGVGRYTAGAVASIAFGTRAPIVDGNVARVLCRIDRIETDPRERKTQAILWRRAEEILPRRNVGDFNSALMELGATICRPRAPTCFLCPVRAHCGAFAGGVQDRIPAVRPSRPTPLHRRATFCIRRGDRWLIEQRPLKGRWAGMWQFVTIEAPSCSNGSNGGRRSSLAKGLPVRATIRRNLGTVTHGLTHRRYEFDVYACECADESGATPLPGAPACSTLHDRRESDVGFRPRKWSTLDGLADFPLPRPHLKIVEMLRKLPGPGQ